MNFYSTRPAFVQKVPVQFLQEHQPRLAEWQAKLKATLEALALHHERFCERPFRCL